MNFTEHDSRNNHPSSLDGEAKNGNYYAFFDRPVPENLAANRRGVLTPSQQSAIQQKIAYHKSGMALIVGMTICMALLALFILWKADSEDGVLSPINLIISGGVVTVSLGVLAAVLTGNIFLFFMSDDFEGGKVESVIGRVIWKGSRYQVHSHSCQLRSLRSGVVLPPPGNYRFYYLPRTGLVVVAEEIAESSGAKSASVLLQILARANHFSLEDLTQNHKGLMSEHQQNLLMAILVLYTFTVLSSVVLCVSILFQILDGHLSALFFLLLIFAALLILQLGPSVAWIIGDLWNGEVRNVEGQVVRQTRRSRYYRSYYYVVGTHKFQISEAAYNAILEGRSYRIYYVPRSRKLVSIEPL